MIFFQNGFTIDNNFITLDRDNFTCIFIHKIFHPSLQYTGCQPTADSLLHVGFVHLHFFGKAKNLKDIPIALESYCTKQSGNRQFLLTIDICIHDIINVCSKLNPRTSEGDYTGRIQLRSVCMGTLSEENTGRTVQLGNNDTFCTVDNKSTFFCHVWNRPQIHILNHSRKIFMIGICTVQLQLCL